MAEINLRKFHASAIARALEQVRKARTGELDASKAEQLLKSANSHYERMLANHEALLSAAKEEEWDVHAAWWDSTEDMYNELCASLMRWGVTAGDSSEVPSKPDVDSMMELKLERLNIPTFDGALHNWLAFKDAFETLVHNRDLPIAYKLGKLRQAVPSSAVPLVGGLYSGGYEELWAALKKRYDNPKQLAEIHVARFLHLSLAADESAKSLLNIVDVASGSLRALAVMKLPFQQWDALTVPIVVSKLPPLTKREWCMHCSPTELSSLSDLMEFLEQRAQSLSTELVRIGDGTDTVSGRQLQRSPTARTVKCNLSTEEGKCQYCRGAHRVMRCPTLLDLPPEKRFEALRKSSLCFNCLRLGHASKQCSSGGCRQCGRKHNTIFCREPKPAAPSSRMVAATTTTSSQPGVLVAPAQPSL
ncbi:uncharacterized protein LOC118736212 [Rhagoletis pomonella]|uniref:uncharacterized protein LOC118736212 n=1 Tax=Rhagoletis pomonella TaxID=28610 RepID=UPI00177A88BE|nr:uncharacterized protein LOC118736212 [Rhagoletis pomonella]